MWRSLRIENMEVPEEPPRTPWFRNNKKRLIIGVVLSVVLLVPTVVYYEVSYNSVNGTHPELVTGLRSAGYFSATFYITVHVWSWAGSLDSSGYTESVCVLGRVRGLLKTETSRSIST